MPWPGGSVGWSVVPNTQKVAGLIPGPGMYLGCEFIPRGMYGRQPIDVLSHIDVSFSLSLQDQ